MTILHNHKSIFICFNIGEVTFFSNIIRIRYIYGVAIGMLLSRNHHGMLRVCLCGTTDRAFKDMNTFSSFPMGRIFCGFCIDYFIEMMAVITQLWFIRNNKPFFRLELFSQNRNYWSNLSGILTVCCFVLCLSRIGICSFSLAWVLYKLICDFKIFMSRIVIIKLNCFRIYFSTSLFYSCSFNCFLSRCNGLYFYIRAACSI